MNNNGITIKVAIVLIAIMMIVVCLFYGCTNSMKLSEIKNYKYLESNGQTYETSRMTDITRDYIHNSDTFIITLDDGSKIYINDYSLHN